MCWASHRKKGCEGPGGLSKKPLTQSNTTLAAGTTQTFHQGSINSVQSPLQMVDDDEDTIATLKVPQKRKRAWEEAAEAQDPEALEAARKEKEMEEDQREKEEFEQRMRVSQRPVFVLVVWCGTAGNGSVSRQGCW